MKAAPAIATNSMAIMKASWVLIPAASLSVTRGKISLRTLRQIRETCHDEDGARAGSQVQLETVITNVSNHEIKVTEVRSNLGAAGVFHIEVRDERGELAPETESFRTQKWCMGVIRGDWCQPAASIVSFTLQPGGRDAQVIEITDYYDIGRPGKYTVQLKREFEKGLIVKSNITTVTVAP